MQKAPGSASQPLYIVACYNCKKTVSQPEGTKRTICPYCGSLFASPDGEASSSGSATGSSPPQQPQQQQPQNRPPSGSSSTNSASSSSKRHRLAKQQAGGGDSRPRSGSGSGNKLLNFFSNLGKSRDRSHGGSGGGKKRSGKADESLPPLSQSPSLTTGRSGGMATLSPIAPASIEGGLYKSQSVTSLLVPQQQQQQQSMPSPRQDYPQPQLTESMLADLTEESKRTGNWSRLSDLFEQAFSSPKDLVAVFRSAQRDPDPSKGSGLNQAFVEAAYATLKDMPYDMQKKVLKANISVLLEKRHTMGGKGGTSSSKDDVRALFVILQNPLLEKVTTFVLFAHLLRCVAALGDFDHHCLVNWLARLEKASFEALLRRIQYFISVRLFPPKTEDLPPLDKASWWVPNAVKVLALLNAANNQCGSRAKVPYTEFYNHTIDSLDLLAEYYTWQNPAANSGFTFCQYPFILSIQAKRSILQRDSETQMIIMAKRSLVAGVAKRNQPSMDMLFLNITVRRSHLVADSMRQISAKQKDLKKKLRVTFEGEAGLDMGGLTKEWFLLLIRSVFLSNSGLFTYDAKSRCYWFSLAPKDNQQEYYLIGALMGLAVYNSINLDVRFPSICYRKLLSPSVVPSTTGTTQLGVCPVTLTDLREVMPELAHGLYELLRHQGDVAEDFGATFEIAYTDGAGKNRTVELKPDGRSISVTNANRQEYVAMYCDYLLNKGVYSKFRSFYLGFHQVCASNALILLRPEEVEHLVCGSPKFDFNELRKVTVYDGYRPNDAQVKWFWDIAINMEPAKQAALLLFITGSDRIPVGGMAEMQMKIVRVNRLEMLPIAHTCFNQIMLPTYKTKATLTERLLLAIDNSEGFGLE
ncbi:hypothetical protein BOX15_Mlig017050g1 [Macrostomum lignano]|uniref:HECT-type E3 ubiquitin transferase n=1 Tax=Macrostomum lignano TaxID=282301 RepID=A0A267GHX3_9PLAT|nr:hypothetical protein BOX15_Mlig017050g1 [Macrostomum lignano]